MEPLVIIPAKGHSERLPNKNMREIGGITLVGRAVDSAYPLCRDNGSLPVVATDIDLLPDGSFGTVRLTREYVSLEHVVFDALEIGNTYETVILLQPTSPFRTAIHVKEAYQQYLDGGYDSLFSAYETPAFIWARAGSKGMVPVNYDPATRPRSQDAMKLYVENGAIYIFSVEMFKRTKCRLGGKIGVYLMGQLESLEIDTPEDYEAAKIIYGGMNADDQNRR